MPNWCSNRLTVFGTEHALTSFLSAAGCGDAQFSLQAFVPCPEELRSIVTGHAVIDGVSVSKWRRVEQPDGSEVSVAISAEELQGYLDQYGATNWYDWQVNNWGTKWDVDANVDENVEDGEAVITFDSAWSPPTAFMDSLAQMFSSLRFVLDYAEPGVCFGGRRVYEGGQCVEFTETSDNASTRHISPWHDEVLGFDDEEEQDSDTDEDDDIEGGE